MGVEVDGEETIDVPIRIYQYAARHLRYMRFDASYGMCG